MDANELRAAAELILAAHYEDEVDAAGVTGRAIVDGYNAWLAARKLATAWLAANPADDGLTRLNEALSRSAGAFLGCLSGTYGIAVRSSGPALIELVDELKKRGLRLKVVPCFEPREEQAK